MPLVKKCPNHRLCSLQTTCNVCRAEIIKLNQSPRLYVECNYVDERGAKSLFQQAPNRVAIALSSPISAKYCC